MEWKLCTIRMSGLFVKKINIEMNISKVCVYLLGEVAGDDSCAEVGHNVGDEDNVGECVEDDDLRRRVVAEERHDHRQDEHVQAQHEQHHQVPVEPARARPLMQARNGETMD